MGQFKVVAMDDFMKNKRCPDCGSDAFVVEQNGGQDFRIWYCARCHRSLLKELVDTRSFFKKVFNM